jgi:hypothetical protein
VQVTHLADNYLQVRRKQGVGKMERLRIAMDVSKASFSSPHASNMDGLDYVQVDDNGSIIAVFNDNTTIDVSELFSSSMINDYKNHKILVRC